MAPAGRGIPRDRAKNAGPENPGRPRIGSSSGWTRKSRDPREPRRLRPRRSAPTAARRSAELSARPAARRPSALTSAFTISLTRRSTSSRTLTEKSSRRFGCCWRSPACFDRRSSWKAGGSATFHRFVCISRAALVSSRSRRLRLRPREPLLFDQFIANRWTMKLVSIPARCQRLQQRSDGSGESRHHSRFPARHVRPDAGIRPADLGLYRKATALLRGAPLPRGPLSRVRVPGADADASASIVTPGGYRASLGGLLAASDLSAPASLHQVFGGSRLADGRGRDC